MNQYTVESGDIKTTLFAKTPNMAVMMAIHQADPEPERLGDLIECKEHGKPESEDYFFKTLIVLEWMGYIELYERA